jgi:SAM-dependent methyltransferase
MRAQVSDRPVYPTWIKSSRIRLFWLLTAGVLLIATIVAFFWLPGLAIAALGLPLLYTAIVITLSSYRLSPRGDDLQSKIHQLLVDEAGPAGRLLDVGCGSGELLIRFAKTSTGEYVGLDFWPGEWGEYSRALAERNARLEGVTGLTFEQGTASKLPFADGSFARVVSSLAFHEVRDAADKTVSLAEALRVLQPGGRFAFVDLFDDPGFYQGRERVLDALQEAGGQVGSARALSEILELKWPMNTGKVLKYAVVVIGTKASDRPLP